MDALSETVLDTAEFVFGFMTVVLFLNVVINTMDISMSGLMAKDIGYFLTAMISIPHEMTYSYGFDGETRKVAVNDLGVRVTDDSSSSQAFFINSYGVTVRGGETWRAQYDFSLRKTEEGKELVFLDDDTSDLNTFCEIFGEAEIPGFQTIYEDPFSLDSSTYGERGMTVRVRKGQGVVAYSPDASPPQKALACRIFLSLREQYPQGDFSFLEKPYLAAFQIDVTTPSAERLPLLFNEVIRE